MKKEMIDLKFIQEFNKNTTENDVIDGKTIWNINEYIDYVFIKRKVLFNTFLKYEIENANFKFDNIRFDREYVEINENQLISYLLNARFALEKIFFNKKLNILSHQIFVELKLITTYCRNHISINGNDFLKKYKISDDIFHNHNSIFNYLFTIFDKSEAIIEHFYKKKHISFQDEPTSRLGEKINLYARDFCCGVNEYNYLVEWTKLLSESSIFFIVRRVRNNLVHDFLNIDNNSNLLLISNLLYILVLRYLIGLSRCIQKENSFY